MTKVAKFEKVSFQQFKSDWIEHVGGSNPQSILNRFNSIKLPKRGTTGSAGYDFFSPITIYLQPGDSMIVPTGIRCNIIDDWFLAMLPRSGHGFKYGVNLANTVGVIDSDYYKSDNEGHILIKLVNDSALAKEINLAPGTAFCQGIFLPYGITEDDDTTTERNGGFGSTDKG